MDWPNTGASDDRRDDNADNEQHESSNSDPDRLHWT